MKYVNIISQCFAYKCVAYSCYTNSELQLILYVRSAPGMSDEYSQNTSRQLIITSVHLSNSGRCSGIYSCRRSRAHNEYEKEEERIHDHFCFHSLCAPEVIV